MCGIVGVHGVDGIEQMLRQVKHRGPDEQGTYYDEKRRVELGVRRLKIIDLNTGSQPIYNEDNSLVIVYNGEIFNYLELRDELIKFGHRFRTQTDTEVIIHAFEQWKLDCFSHFIGQWAFCIYDGRRMFLCRDRMGEKPLYYMKGQSWFAFASEIKALHARFPTAPRIVEEFWAFEKPPEGETMFEGVSELPPASYLVYDCEACKIEKIATYWSIKTDEYDHRPENVLVDELRALLDSAIKLRLRSDVPWGVALSGGLDSSIVACLAKPDIVFSVQFPLGPKFDELRYAEIVAKKIGAEQHVLTLTPNDMREGLSDVIWHLDQPVATASPIADFALSQLASQHVKVLLGGQGSDECFGGYARYLIMKAEMNLLGIPELDNYQSMMRYFWSPEMFSEPYLRYFKLICRKSFQHLKTTCSDGRVFFSEAEPVRSFFERCHDPISAMGLTDIHLTLPPLIRMNDRSASAVGIENRSPFLDHRLIEFAFRLPPEMKIKEFRTKYLLRAAMRGIVPDEILDRTDKKGLIVPFGPWLNGKDAPLAAWRDDLIISLGHRINKPMGAGGNGRGEFDRSLYRDITLELWFRRFFPEFNLRSTSAGDRNE